ncbi:hypothetical protein [Bacillus thuringiensis]|uniref:Uncharacterized protein n=1 Tax=Bacillus thuringiensis TaxID=1428 RepID=A0A9X6WNE8_BACTU|nr:hypothetical protein [Bacillus thuringiensis]PFJ38776.1 hypothetical protein COJ15_17010 [Bacillus thuringiensis]
MNVMQYKSILKEFNEGQFKNVETLFQNLETHEYSKITMSCKRLHFILNDRRYLCAELEIGKVFPGDERIFLFADISIFEDNIWSSYFNGAIFPEYLKEAKAIQKEIISVLEKIQIKIENEHLADELTIIDYSKNTIEEIESMTEEKIKEDKYLYDKYHQNV